MLHLFNLFITYPYYGGDDYGGGCGGDGGWCPFLFFELRIAFWENNAHKWSVQIMLTSIMSVLKEK